MSKHAKYENGSLRKAFQTACVTGAASLVGVGVGLTVAPVVLPVAAVALAGSTAIGAATGMALTSTAMHFKK